MDRFRWIWPSITNENDAESAARRAADSALFVTVCTGGFSIMALITGKSYAGIDGGGLVDASLFAIIAWRLSRYSFPWSVVGLILMLIETVWMLGNHASHVGVVTALIVLAFIGGVRGTSFIRKQGRRISIGETISEQADNTTIEPS